MTKALYVHVPFCDKICAYCDFTRVVTHPKLIAEYLGALKAELESYPLNFYKTMYIGGGTPTALNEKELTILFEILKPSSKMVQEYTIEVNPESLTLDKVKVMKRYGINRVSLGVQTFDENELKLLHRSHSFEDIINAINLLRFNGITNISIDLIYGLPLQTLESFERSIHEAFKLPITHLSLYSLTIEPHSEFGRQKLTKVSDEMEELMYFKAIELFKSYGFHQYEISNFTKEQPSQHNTIYWHSEDYLGIGPGAVSLLKNQRIENTKNLLNYQKGLSHESIIDLSVDDQRYEFMMMGLRLKEGIELVRYLTRFNESMNVHYEKQIDDLIKKGWLEIKEGYLRCTEEGFPLLNTVLGELLDE
jgi:oxygen-independent coproporphyrinogen-3 oxidase